MNYEIIKDDNLLLEFIESLPDLTEDETYYVCLFARSKYVSNKEISHINSDKAQLKRFTSVKSRLYDKIKQLECPLGSYKQKSNIVPQECLAVYINPNPRSNTKATRTALMRCATLLATDAKGFNLHQEIISEVQKAKSRSVYIDFDFDVDDKAVLPEIVNEVSLLLNPSAYNILETRGGYHVLVKPKEVQFNMRNKWYQELNKIQNKYSNDKDNHGDNMIPIPGCTQGNFIPHFIL